MPLQPVPYQYSPRTFTDIEERLRRLEREGSNAFTQFDPLLPGFSVGSDGAAFAAYRLDGITAELVYRLRFGSSGITPTTGQDSRWCLQVPDVVIPSVPSWDLNMHIPLFYDVSALGAMTGSLYFPDTSTAQPETSPGFYRGHIYISSDSGSADLNNYLYSAWIRIGTVPVNTSIVAYGRYLLI